MKQKLNKLIVAGMLPLICTTAYAASPEKIGDYKDWTAYHFSESGGQVCYMVSKPKTSKGNYSKRGDIFAVITHRPNEKSKNVFSFIAGYDFKAGSEVRASIGKQNFTLFTQGDSAWASDTATDNKIANAVRRGSTLVVKGTSSRGTDTVDTFGLGGSSAAYKAISTKCGI